ncbi:MAG: hypothetical protein ABFD16_02105 [Thermoguttaceae bacterium]
MTTIRVLVATITCVAAGTWCWAQQTEVTVFNGAVRIETKTGDTLVSAGQKAVATGTGEVTLSVDDPLVANLLVLDRWVQAERQAKQVKIAGTQSMVCSIESQRLIKCASLIEMPNRDTKPSQMVAMGATGWDKSSRVYDTEGHLLTFETSAGSQPRVNIHFLKSVPPGESFRFVITMQVTPDTPLWRESPLLWRDGKVRSFINANPSRNWLNYFQVVLPRSAVFVDATHPTLAVESLNGRVSLTFRDYTGSSAAGGLVVRYLWPDEDQSTLADMPPENRGVENPRTLEYGRQRKAVAAGQPFTDRSTPLNALLSLESALVRNDKKTATEVFYVLAKGIEKLPSNEKDKAAEWSKLRKQLENAKMLWTPDWPAEPKEGYLHPVFVAPRDAISHCPTGAFVFAFTKGSWSFMGTTGPQGDVDRYRVVLTWDVPIPSQISPPAENAKRLLLGTWQIEPSHANRWEFSADGTIIISHPVEEDPPAKGTYTWISNDTIEIKTKDKFFGDFEERLVIKSIDNAIVIFESAPGGKGKSPLTFTRIRK